MTNSNKPILSQSSPKHIPSGNNENESENQRNSQQKNKNFMSPTISATSKQTTTTTTTTPNKKIFSEWKSPNSKMGNSNSCLRKSLPKIPSFSSPKNVVNSHKHNDELDSFDVPYDSLTNYLSPRPRFLRYRPNRKREILVSREEKSSSDSDVDSLGDNEDILIKKENEEIKISDEICVIDEEDEGLDESEEVNWGLLKSLIVFLGLFFCTMSICSMNSYSATRQELGGFKIGDEHGMNTSLGVVSLRNLASTNWVLDGKPRSMMGVFENNHSIVKFVEKFGRVYKSSEIIEIPEKIESLDGEHAMNMSLRIVSLCGLKSGNWVLDEKTRSMMGVFEINHSTVELDKKLKNVNQINESVAVKDIEILEKNESLDDYYQTPARVNQISDITETQEIEISEKIGSFDDYNQVQSQLQNEVRDEQVEVSIVGIPNSNNEDVEVEIVAPIAALELSEGPGIENVRIPNSKNEDEQVEIEAPTIALELTEGPGIENVAGIEANNHDFDATFSGVELENGGENTTENSVVKPKEGELANEVEAFPENQSETVEFGPKNKEKPSEYVEYDHLRLTSSDLVWSTLSPILLAFGFLAFFVLKFYGKCKRASSKTRSSNVKLCSNVGKTSKSRPGLPPKSMEKTVQYQLNAPLVEKVLNPPVSVNPQENFDRDIHIIIPKVKQLGEFEVGVEFTQSFKSSVRSEIELMGESVFSTPDTARVVRRSSVSGRGAIVQPSSSELSTAESFSCGSYISQYRTSMKDGKEEMSKATPTPRRSSRLRNKGVTSP